MKGCTHSGGGRGVNEDANLTEFGLGGGIEGLGVLNTAAMVVEQGLERAFLICAAMNGCSAVASQLKFSQHRIKKKKKNKFVHIYLMWIIVRGGPMV